MSILPRFPHFALVPLVPLMVTGFCVGWGLAAAAGADTTGDPVTDLCPSAFSSQTTSAIGVTTDPPARSNVQPGQRVKLDVAWAPGWDSLSLVLVCVRVAGTIDHDLSFAESPGVDDGAFHHEFTVPDGLVDGEAICARAFITGNPAGDATQASFVSRQSCFEVPIPDTDSPTTSPTTAPASAPPPADSPSAPAPPPAGSVPNDTSPPQPAAPTADVDTEGPVQSAAGSGDAPAFPILAPAPAPAPSGGPTPLPILPETGFGSGGRGVAELGFAAVGLGLPALYFGRRRRRAVFGGWN